MYFSSKKKRRLQHFKPDALRLIHTSRVSIFRLLMHAEHFRFSKVRIRSNTLRLPATRNHWELFKQASSDKLKLIKKTLDKEIFGNRIKSFEYVSDIVMMQILFLFGGPLTRKQWCSETAGDLRRYTFP